MAVSLQSRGRGEFGPSGCFEPTGRCGAHGGVPGATVCFGLMGRCGAHGGVSGRRWCFGPTKAVSGPFRDPDLRSELVLMDFFSIHYISELWYG